MLFSLISEYVWFAFRLLASLGSFQVFGIASTSLQSEISSDTRPVLIHPIIRSQQSKLLEIEFEINSIDKESKYRIKIASQSLEIKYNAVNI